jgi:hypothetical protein
MLINFFKYCLKSFYSIYYYILIRISNVVSKNILFIFFAKSKKKNVKKKEVKEKEVKKSVLKKKLSKLVIKRENSFSKKQKNLCVKKNKKFFFALTIVHKAT